MPKKSHGKSRQERPRRGPEAFLAPPSPVIYDGSYIAPTFPGGDVTQFNTARYGEEIDNCDR